MSDLRLILSANLNKAIDADLRPGERRSVRAWAMRRGLEVKLIDRISKNEHAVTLDTLQTLADAMGIKPWHLLLEDYNPAQAIDAPITPDERAMLSRLRRLLDT